MLAMGLCWHLAVTCGKGIGAVYAARACCTEGVQLILITCITALGTSNLCLAGSASS